MGILSNKSFKFKIIFSYVFIVLASFSFIAFFLDKNLEENSLREIKSSLVTQANLIGSQIPASSLRTEDSLYLGLLVKGLKPKTKCRVTIINPKGKVLADSDKTNQEILAMENHSGRPEVRAALEGATGIDTHYSYTLKIEMLYVALPIKEKNEVVGILRLALPLESVQRTLFVIRKTILLGLVFALGLAFVLGLIVAGNAIKPINRMIQVSRKYSEGDFSRRIIQSSKDELGQLAATLNKMAQGLEDKIREIKTQNHKLEAVFNSMVEGIIVVDEATRIISINPAIEKIFHISEKEAQGKVFLEAIRNNDISEVINMVLKTQLPYSAEIGLVLPVRRIFEVNATPVFDNDEISGCLVVTHDITELRRLETIRKDFVANVSHELKTPLTSIKGFVETLLEGALDDKENNRGFLKIIHDHAERLNTLVNDLLSLSHLEVKEIKLGKEEFNLREQLAVILQGFNSQLKRKNIEIKDELPSGLQVRADKGRLEQVLTNLLDNAIKFNKEKGVIKVYSQDLDNKVKITIEDSGIGIPEKDIPRIFERFYRVDKARSRELGGTGLGLSIVKHIVELHGGSVGVESTEGLGSKFFFILPK